MYACKCIFYPINLIHGCLFYFRSYYYRNIKAYSLLSTALNTKMGFSSFMYSTHNTDTRHTANTSRYENNTRNITTCSELKIRTRGEHKLLFKTITKLLLETECGEHTNRFSKPLQDRRLLKTR